MMSNSSMSPKLLAVFAVAAVTLVGLIGWFGLVAPQHSKAEKLDAQIAEAKEQLKVAKLLARSQKADKSKTSGLGLLNTAMPEELQMPSVLRQVQRLASASDVELNTFTPSVGTPMNGYSEVPISLAVTGRYSSLQDFLHRIRTQARESAGRIHASGRLFDVKSVSLSPANVPQLTASIALSTFVYTGAALPVPDATATTTEDTSTSEEGTS